MLATPGCTPSIILILMCRVRLTERQKGCCFSIVSHSPFPDLFLDFDTLCRVVDSHWFGRVIHVECWYSKIDFHNRIFIIFMTQFQRAESYCLVVVRSYWIFFQKSTLLVRIRKPRPMRELHYSWETNKNGSTCLSVVQRPVRWGYPFPFK